MIYKICSRSCSLRTFVRKWNEKKSNGVFISLGGTGRNVPVGNKTGGTLWSFLMATYDPRGKEGLGYLHIFVNYQQREAWCQQNGVPFILSVPPEQLTIEQQIALQNLVPNVQPEFQVPAGYALVPENYQPIPAGYALVPQSQDLPPDYDQASKM